MKNLDNKIIVLQQAMQQIAQRICNQNPDYRYLAGQLNILLEIKQEESKDEG